MYIQPSFGKEKEPLQIPDNYSGTAMMPTGQEFSADASALAGQPGEYRREGENNPPPEMTREGAETARRAGGEPAPESPAAEPSYGGESADTTEREGVQNEGGALGKTGGEVPVFAGKNGKKPTPPGGILNFHALAARFPFLSSLLPPKRKNPPQGNSDFLLILGLILLLSGEQDDDILPFLLLLLLV